jgi:hypothetical protein
MAVKRPKHDRPHPPPRGSVLLLTCMDLRLLDDIVHYMDHAGLRNRYDHLIFAGASLGVLLGESPCADKEITQPSRWKDVFYHQLRAAYDLHKITDVYILEHRHCGAYHSVFKVCREFGDSKKELADETACHLKYATRLKKEIISWAKDQEIKLNVKLLIMGLDGHVKLLK